MRNLELNEEEYKSLKEYIYRTKVSIKIIFLMKKELTEEKFHLQIIIVWKRFWTKLIDLKKLELDMIKPKPINFG